MNYKFYLNDVLIDEPIGWDSATLNISRNLKNHGITYKYSSDLEFIGNGFNILRNEFEANGVLGKVVLQIYIEDVLQFTGTANFTNYVRNYGDLCSITINFEEENESLLISQNTTKEVVIEPNITLNMHPKYILQDTRYFSSNINFDLLEQNTYQNDALGYFIPFNLPNRTDPLDAVLTPFGNDSLGSCEGTSRIANFRITGGGNVIVKVKLKANITVDYSANVGGSYGRIYLSIRYGNNTNNCTLLNLTEIFYTQIVGGTTTLTNSVDLDLEQNIILNNGDYIGFGLVYFGNQSTFGNLIVFSNRREYDLIYTTEILGSETQAKAVTVFNAFEQISNNLLGYNDSFISNYFSSDCAKNTALTNGFLIRNFEKPLVLSFDLLYNNLHSFYCLGYGFDNGKLRVEPLKYWYNTNEIVLNFSDIKDIKEEVSSDLIYNTLSFGYKKNGTEEGSENGNTLDGFNTLRKYSTPINQSKNEYNFESDFIADAYAIEYTRRQQYLNKSTNDWKFDNDTFIIALNKSNNTICEKNENFSIIENSLSPETGYNFRFSPSRSLLNHNQIFSLSYAKKSGASATFTSGTKNTDLNTKMIDGCSYSYENKLLSEKQNLSWDDVNNTTNEPLFDPIKISFTAPLSLTAYNLLKSKPNAKITIQKNSTILFNAYLLTVNYKPNEGIADFVLIKQNSNAYNGCNVDYVEVYYVECDYVY